MTNLTATQPSRRKATHEGSQSVTTGPLHSHDLEVREPVEEVCAAVVEGRRLTSDFPLGPGIPAEDFLCVPEPDEDECLSSGLDGDETSYKQVSNGRALHQPQRSCPQTITCEREEARWKLVRVKAVGTERRGSNVEVFGSTVSKTLPFTKVQGGEIVKDSSK